MSQSKAAIVAPCLKSQIWYSETVTTTSRYHLTKELRRRSIGRLEAGQSQIKVARWQNVSPSVVHKLWQQFLSTDSASIQGRPRSTTSADDRYVALCSRRNRTATSPELRCFLAASSGRRERMQWVRQHMHWTCDQGRSVLFTDEPRFSLASDSSRIFIWKELGTRFHP
ncbi:transposable element Tcb1 transposase [Trichonephila clavipes]|nr:transposable element Tcb1 transposase [Trichonephila clavipes]